MVFGWGKKPKPVAPRPEEPRNEEIALSEIEKVLADLQARRGTALVERARAFRTKTNVQMRDLHGMAVQLEHDDLNVDDIDRHLRSLVDRGKKQVISIIKAETSEPLPEVNTPANAIEIHDKAGRSLKKMGDVLGRQTRVIHIFAKKYAGRLKTILSDLQNERNEVNGMIGRYNRVQDSAVTVIADVGSIRHARKTLDARAEKISRLEEAVHDFDRRIDEINRDISKITSSERYSELARIREVQNRLQEERSALSRRINDSFTRISRPLGKYAYVSSLDKEQKEILHAMIENPFKALSRDRRGAMTEILQSVRKGVESGSVSVKDVEKSVQCVDEISQLLDSFITEKSGHDRKEKDAQELADSIDLDDLKQSRLELEKTTRDREDAQLKTTQFRAEISEIEERIPRLIAGIERVLYDVSSTHYIIRLENF